MPNIEQIIKPSNHTERSEETRIHVLGTSLPNRWRCTSYFDLSNVCSIHLSRFENNGIPTDHLWFRMLPVWPDWAIFGRHWWQNLYLLSAAEGRAELVFTWVVVVVVLVGFLLHKITQSLYLSLTIKIIKPVQSADLYFFVFNKYFYHLLFLLLQQKALPNNGELLTNLFRIKT